MKTLLRPTRLLALSLGLVLLVAAVPTATVAQDAASVMQDVRDKYERMFADVDHYMMKTDMYTAYYKKEAGEGPLAFKSAMQMTGQNAPMGGGVAMDQYQQFEAIAQHGTYAGVETIDGVRCYVIRVDDPSKIDANLSQAETITYYIGADDPLMRRMEMEGLQESGGPGQVVVNMKDYRTTDGVTLPFTMEFIMPSEGMSEEQRQQMEEMKKQLDNMPEAQRKRMEQMMGDQFEKMEKMMSGEPMVITVQEVEINGTLPEGVF